ncbi:hypothetical protein [Micromonospora sp. RTGN7]|uniref:hypothetical protein n=1 Tax=Micromonospora sp. RTGN7 TaxID=3016526 RepID=UPI0029FF11C4|nr:hypothetical protein [Micromonospora sp. RTGN7]
MKDSVTKVLPDWAAAESGTGITASPTLISIAAAAAETCRNRLESAETPIVVTERSIASK